MPKNDGKMQTFNSADGADENCDVVINNGTITVSYREGVKAVVCQGPEVSPGHYDLSSPDGGRATLHRFPEANRLVGEWKEGSKEGVWLVTLL